MDVVYKISGLMLVVVWFAYTDPKNHDYTLLIIGCTLIIISYVREAIEEIKKRPLK